MLGGNFMDNQIEVFQKIINNDQQAYESLFKEYYPFLCSYAYGHTRDKHAAEEIVEDFFVNLWNNRHKVVISKSVRAYFIGSIHNRCINYLQRERSRYIASTDIADLTDNEKNTNEKLAIPEVPTLLVAELEENLLKAIEKLPENCKEIFLLSRYHDYSYHEIAMEKNISVNTVKTQIKIALCKLKEELKDYLVVFIAFFLIKF